MRTNLHMSVRMCVTNIACQYLPPSTSMRDRDILARRVLRIGNFLDIIVGDLPGDLPGDLADSLPGDRLLGDFLLGEYLEGLFVILLLVLVAVLPNLSAFEDKKRYRIRL